MLFVATCPFCPTRINRVPDEALGASLHCPQCGNYFTLAPVDEPLLQPAFRAFRGRLARTPPRSPSGPARSEAGPGNESARPLPELTPSSIGAVYGSPANHEFPARQWLWPALVACLLVLIAAPFLWRSPTRQANSAALLFDDPDPHQLLVVTPDNRQMIRDFGRVEWADAATESLRQGIVHIRIAWAKMDPAPHKEEARPPSLARRLLIQVQMANLPPELVPFKNTPVLLDDRGKQYALRGSLPRTAVDQSDAAPSSREAVQEILVFEAPADDVQSLKLDLPAATWGRTGSGRFRIPRSMIQPAQ